MSRLRCFLVVLLLLPAAVSAQDGGQVMLGFKAVTADSDFAGNDDATLGLGAVLGYRLGGITLEYDYSKASELDLSPFIVFSSSGSGSTVQDTYDVYSHSLFLNFRTDTLFYAEAKLGYAYLRFKEHEGLKRVLDEQEHAAVGLTLGVGGKHGDIGIQYLLLGEDYRQFNLLLRGYF